MVPLRDRLPTRRPSYVNWLLIVLNIGAFVWTQALLSVSGPRGQMARAHELLLEHGLVPARLLLILQYFVVNLLSGLGSLGGTGGGVAFFAHLGGFVVGALLLRPFTRGKTPRDHDRWSRLRPPAQGRRRHDPWGW